MRRRGATVDHAPRDPSGLGTARRVLWRRAHRKEEAMLTAKLPKLPRTLVTSGALVVGLAGGLTVAFASGGFERPTEINNGLVNAANSVLQNLYGSDVASIRGFNPQPDPPRLVLYLNLDSEIPTDLVIFSKATSSSPCTNVAKVTIGNGEISVVGDTAAALALEQQNLNLGGLPPGPICPTEIDVTPEG
jgi:hypothetical protein